MKHLLIGIVTIGVIVLTAVLVYEKAEAPTKPEDSTVPSVTPPTSVPSGVMIEIYDGISYPANTEIVDVSGRGLSGSLKAEVRMLSNMRELDVSDNSFTGLPAEVGQLSKLEILDLSNNPFTGLPYELGNLSNLKVLDLRGTNYSEADLGVIRETLPSSTEVLVD